MDDAVSPLTHPLGEGSRSLLRVGMRNGPATLQDSLAASYEMEHTLITRSSHPAPRNSSARTANCVHTKTGPRMLVAALSIMAKAWKQPRCPAGGERIDTRWHMRTRECYSALRRNEPPRHEKLCTWLSDRSSLSSVHMGRVQLHGAWKRQSTGTAKRWALPGRGVGLGRAAGAAHRGFLGG